MAHSCKGKPACSAEMASAPDRRRAVGQLGEKLAAEHLQRLGFTIIACNARTRHGEIDLIAFGEHALVFAEVKTRTASETGVQGRARIDDEPLAWLRSSQCQRIRRLACAWLASNAEWRPRAQLIRFDAIGVLVDRSDNLLRLDHIEGAW